MSGIQSHRDETQEDKEDRATGEKEDRDQGVELPGIHPQGKEDGHQGTRAQRDKLTY
ncbi:MAG: hypothetical protein GY696_12545 [Gammaproteobacteria bacterium]|nr:hypothetical protein [Gammaproteobacteria bacterium]